MAAALLLAGAAGGCVAGPGPQGRETGRAASACDPVFDWTTDRRWDLAVLDGPAAVVPGGVLHTGAAPYRPRTAAVTVPVLRGAPTAAQVMDSLSRAVRAPLAGPGRETSEVARDTDIRFESAARPVYYAGLRFVTATFRYRCAGDRTVRGEGGVLTWETDSLTVGLVDCAGPRDHDPDSEPARRAATLRCPPGRPAPADGVS